MVDQLTDVQACRLCGAPLAGDRRSPDNICDTCAAYQETAPGGSLPRPENGDAFGAAPYGTAYESRTQPQPLDPYHSLNPDHPRWGAVLGIGTWLFSVAAIFIVPTVAVLAWYFIQRSQGAAVPDALSPEAKEEFLKWLMSPQVVLVSIVSTVIAHVVTFAFCWMVVTKMRKQPFLPSLGWNWAGKSFGYWMLVSLAIIFAVISANALFIKFLPQGETPFEQMLNTSDQVKIAVAAMAVLTAPFAEELVYRGVLFAGLRSRLSLWPTVAIVTLMFAGVHVAQYWGAWASMAGLTLLSLILTTVRGLTKSILPGVLIHTVFNLLGALEILEPKRQAIVFGVFFGCVGVSLLIWFMLKSRRVLPAQS